jgi:2-oxoglutarate dehydrogenase complex dehydrogenase (E1) component-like enzyme
MATPKSETSGGSAAVIDNSVNNGSNPERERVFSAFRQWGYLEGDLDPLGFLRPRPHPDLQIENEYAREARAIYCSTIGVEITSPIRNAATGSTNGWSRRPKK